MVRVGLWGAFDLEHFGDALGARIVRMELGRRVVGLEVLTYAPIGYVGRNRFEDRSNPAAPLGTWTEERLDELAREMDVLVIGSGGLTDAAVLAAGYGMAARELERRQVDRFFIEGLAKHEVDVPTAWNAVGIVEDPDRATAARYRAAMAQRAYVSVRDEASRDRLAMAGVDREVFVAPDPGLLVDRAFPREGLERTIARLRGWNAYPEGDALIVQGSGALVEHADTIADQVSGLCRDRDLTPVLVETGPIHGDATFADALATRLERLHRLPSEAGVEEVVAAIAWSAGFVGSSLRGNVTAAAYDRPAVLLNLPGGRKLTGAGGVLGLPERVVGDPAEIADAFDRVWSRGSIAARVEDLRGAIDRHFDRIAQLAVGVDGHDGSAPVMPGSTVDDERERYARAARALRRRTAAQQAAFVERQRDLEEWLLEQATQIVDKDIRFTKLWRKLHEADRHYNWHKRRADQASVVTDKMQEEIDWLRALLEDRDATIERQKRDIGKLSHGVFGRLNWLLIRARRKLFSGSRDGDPRT
jgi:polysaccharide pyruvyl transferase WcaK-like protein